jgi:hypothetical protein
MAWQAPGLPRLRRGRPPARDGHHAVHPRGAMIDLVPVCTTGKIGNTLSGHIGNTFAWLSRRVPGCEDRRSERAGVRTVQKELKDGITGRYNQSGGYAEGP